MMQYSEREGVYREERLMESYTDWAKTVTVCHDFLALDCDAFVFKAMSFISNQAKQRDCKSLSVGLSGGVDSAVVAALAAKTGIDTLLVTVVADGFIRKEDVDHAAMIARYLNVPQEVIDISDICKSIQVMRLPGMHHIIMGIRNTIIKEIAENQNSVLIGTGNKTETYSGLFSANSYLGQIFPLGSLFKSQIYQLAKFLNLPDFVINKISHGGVEGQKADDFLGMPSNVFDVAAAVCDGEYESDISVPAGLLEHIKRNKDLANVFFSFPELQ